MYRFSPFLFVIWLNIIVIFRLKCCEKCNIAK
nr:MAG TPA: hypothetical protein [Caudoviricetes sp.]